LSQPYPFDLLYKYYTFTADIYILVRRRHISHVIVSVIFIITITLNGWFHFDQKQRRIISWDTFGYYLYLPSLFIYADPGLEKQEVYERINEKYDCTYTFYQFSPGKDGRSVIKYNSGLSFIFLPFFGAAHGIALLTGAEADGFSPPYQWAVFISFLVFCFAGVYLLNRILLLFFDSGTAFYTLTGILFGTNFLFLSGFPMSVHTYLFTFYAGFLLVSIKWNRLPGIRNSVGLGFLAGAIVLIRPTDIVAWLIPLLWNVDSFSSLREKVRFLYRNRKSVMVAAATAFLVFLPQIIYWKYSSGSWFYNGYTNAGEGIDWTNPHTFDFLFSFRKGWLIYTPLMIFGIAGFYFLFKRNPKVFYAVFIFFILNLYLVSAWTNWWYAGSFSSRAIGQSYAVMAIPFGYFIAEALRWRPVIRIVTFAIMALLLLLNLFQTWQYKENIIDAERMTRRYYFRTFLQTTPPDAETKKLLLAERPDLIMYAMPHPDDYLHTNSFLADYVNSGEIKDEYKSQPDSTGTQGIMLTEKNRFTPLLQLHYREITRYDHAVLKISGHFYTPLPRKKNLLRCVTYLEYEGKVYHYRTMDPPINSDRSSGRWNDFTFYYMTPDPRTENDVWTVNFWYAGSDTVWVSNLKVDIYEPVKYGILR